MRKAIIERNTAETQISLELVIDGKGASEIATGCGFLDHMLTLFAKHSRFDLTLKCNGDTEVDFHHTVEDIGIALGQAIKKALGENRGIVRYGSAILPMDESLILSAVDISGRGHLEYGLEIPCEKVGEFDTELVEEFFISFVRNSDVTLHIKQFYGKNSHHIIEGIFKAVGRALCKAVFEDLTLGGEIPSTKGLL